jgi:hypothetical protein
MMLRKLSTLALATIAMVLATTTLGHADPGRGGARGGVSGRPGPHVQSRPGLQSRPGFQGRSAFDARRFDHRFDHRFDGRRFDHRFQRFGRGPVIVAPFFAVPFVWSYSGDPASTYGAPATNYWYYCPSYGAYYPSVQSCPVPWVTVPG